MFQCNIGIFSPQLPSYKYFLNSEDTFFPDLTMDSLRAKGGTIALWKCSLDPYITVLPHTSAAVLPIPYVPGVSPSIHIIVYLPTRGQERTWMIELATLTMVIYVKEAHPDLPFYIRGDSNVNPNHPTRVKIFQEFLDRFILASLNLGHSIYHHFMGWGRKDSQLDDLISSNKYPDTLVEILC